MSKLFRTFLLSAALLLSFAVRAQVYIGDYTVNSYVSGYSSIASWGTELTALSGDDMSATVSLPFTFQFGTQTCTSIMVSTNGQIGIGSADPASSGYQEHTSDMNIIVPMGLDFDLSHGGHVYWDLSGSTPDQVLVVEYDHIKPYSDTAASSYCSFQVWIHESGDIDFVYDTCSVIVSQNAYAFLHETGVSSTLALVGSWSSITPSRTASVIGLSSTNNPEPGLTVSFTRPSSNCPRPLNFVCASPTQVDSVVMTWSAADNTSMWEIRCDTVGTMVDSMMNIYTSADTFFVFTNLVAGGHYDVYIRTDCGSEQSFWVGPLTIIPGTYIMPATGSHTIYGCGGVIYDDGGPSANYSSNCSSTLVIYPTSTDSIVVLSGTVSTESCCDYLRIYDGAGTSGTLLFNGQGSNLTIPSLRSLSGPLTLYFYSDGSVIYGGFEVFVSCERAPRCRSIEEVEVDNVAGASAFVSWTLRGSTSNPAYYILNTYNLDDTAATVITDTTSNLYYMLSGLDPSTNYRVSVSSVCDTDTIAGGSVEFFTRCLVGGVTNPSGTGTSLTSGVPVNTSWGNTFCQSIYTAAELAAMGLTAGPIEGITYTWSTSGSYQKDLTIFLGHTTNSSFASYSPLTGAMTQVYNGLRNTTDVGTIEYHFTTPFVWDGVSNIVVSSFVNQPSGASHTSSGFYGYSTNCGTTRTIYSYRDGSAYTMSSLTGSSSSTSTFRPNITFIKPCDTTATCAAPNVVVRDVQSDQASIIWAPGNTESSWDVYYKATDEATWTLVESAVAEHSYTFTNLRSMTTYNVRIVPDCDSAVFGMAEFTTPCVPLATMPFNEDFENFTASSTMGSPTTPCWTRHTSYPSSNYPYLSTSYAYSGSKSIYFYSSGNYYSYLALPAIGIAMDSLQVSFAAYKTSATYSILVGVMTDPDDFSTFDQIAEVSPSAVNTWQMFEIPLNGYTGHGQYIAFACTGATSVMYLDDVEVSYLSPCPRPSNVTVTSTSLISASITWVDTATNNFEIEYGPAGFAHGSGTITTSAAPNVTIYGLNHSTPYDVYVRGICTGDTSNWSFVTHFTTECGAIDSIPRGFNFVGWGTGTTARPTCWSCGGYGNYPYITTVTNTLGSTTSVALYMYSYSSNRVYAIMPELDSVSYPIEMTQVVFRAWTNSTISTSYSHKIIVGVSQNNADLSTFTPLDTLELTSVPEYYEVAFDTVAGLGKYITFVSTSLDGASYNYAYLDSVRIELIPDCQRPNDLVSVSCTHNTADITWSERGSASEWQVEYGPRGFLIGTGTRLNTYNNPLTLTGLTPATEYDFYVRSTCDINVYSEWSRQPGIVVTRQNPAQVPYFYDFEDADEWNEWQTNSNHTVNWYRGTAVGNGTNGYDNPGTHAMYISADTGRTCSTNMDAVVNASAYRDIDFGDADSSFIISFRAAAGGTSTAAYDGLMVFLVDSDIPVEAPSANITSPWGIVTSLSPLATVRLNHSWNTYSALIEGISGVHRLAFFWFNQSTGAANFIGYPGSIDDVSVQYVECPRPANFRTENLGVTTTDVTWFGAEDADYRVYLRHNGTTLYTGVVNTNRIHFTDLDPATDYNMIVRRLCSETDSSQLSGVFNFRTKLCPETSNVVVGDTNSSTTSYFLPVCNYYNYSLTQMIYDASELGGAGEITAISFYYTGSAAMTKKTNCTVHFSLINGSEFSTAFEPVIIDTADMMLVYSGSLNCEPGWNTFFLNAPYSYDGTSNLLITIDDNFGAYDGTSYTFKVAPTTGIKAVCHYSDSYNPDLSNLYSVTGITSQTYAMRPVMTFEKCAPSSCPTPVLRDAIVRADGATFRWRNTGVKYHVSYRYANRSSWVVENYLTEDTFFVTGTLSPYTDYVYCVRQFCDSATFSNWAYGTFNSSDLPCLPPMDLHVTEVTHKSVSLAWTPEETNIGYYIHIFNSAFSREINSYTARKTITGLQGGVTYYAAIRSNCEGYDEPSYWSDTISFTTDVCPDVSNVAVSDVQGNSAVIDWTEGGRADSWEIEWGPMGFSQGHGDGTVTVSSHPYTITGLVGDTPYDVYVRALCEADFPSEHWASASFTTLYSGISAADDGRVQLFPNPTSSDVVLTLPSTANATRVEVIDIAGRVVLTYSLPAGVERHTIEASKLTEGAYYVRVASEDYTSVKKLVVR